jgi:putative acetyltransferase
MATELSWRIVPGGLGDPRVIGLLQTHVAAAMADMPSESCHALDVAGLQRPEISFWAIWDGAEPVGVGALKDMIRHIIAIARARGFRRLSLETGAIPYFLPARALYARHGFTECGPYEGYQPDPNSVFMTLDLAADPATST